jgi:hypothetical protein
VKKVCCVCGKDLGEVSGPAHRLSHGFCEACYRSELRAWEARLDAVDKQAQSPPLPASNSPSA